MCPDALFVSSTMYLSEIEKEYIKRRYVPHIRHRGEELIKLRYYSARRWIVERTNSWHNRFRKLLVRCEKKSQNYLALISLACCFLSYGIKDFVNAETDFAKVTDSLKELCI
jgi:hypothetical protein